MKTENIIESDELEPKTTKNLESGENLKRNKKGKKVDKRIAVRKHERRKKVKLN